MNKTVLVWITNPAACDNIVKAGKRIADVKTVSEVQPTAMVTGLPGDRNKNLFLEQLRSFDQEIPIYTVDARGNALKLP